MSKIRGIAEIVLFVNDQVESAAFYEELLELERLSGPPAPAPVFLKAGDGSAGVPQMIVLFNKSEQQPTHTFKNELHHLAFEIEPGDFDTMVQRLEQAGLETRFGVHPVIPSRTAYVDDPDGNEVELICRSE